MDQQEQGAAIYMPEHKAEHTERAPKPKLTKAERRELQERQRAAKLASRGSGGGQATSSSGPKVAQGAATPPPTTSSKTASTQRRVTYEDRTPEKRVHMFSHLDDYKRGMVPSASKSGRGTFDTRDLAMLYDVMSLKEDSSTKPHALAIHDHLVTTANITPANTAATIKTWNVMLDVRVHRKECLFRITGEVHPTIATLGRKYASGEVTGATARAVAMLVAFKHVVMDYSTPPDKMLSRDLDKKIRPMMQYLIDCRSHSVSMGNAYKALRNIIAKSPPSSPEAEAKAGIVDKINEFINIRITLAAAEIGKNAITKIREEDVILTYGRSSLVESILVSAQGVKRGSFRVIVVDSLPGVEGRQLADTLSAEGVPCTYVLLTAISYIMREVTKVFIGASAMMSNGTVLSRVGTAVVAMMARSHNLPVMFCCETYKFCERVQLDSIVYNELGNSDDLLSAGSGNADEFRTLPNLKLLNLRYDLTPIKYVTLVITEFGFLPPTSVPVLIREMTRREDKDDKY